MRVLLTRLTVGHESGTSALVTCSTHISNDNNKTQCRVPGRPVARSVARALTQPVAEMILVEVFFDIIVRHCCRATLDLLSLERETKDRNMEDDVAGIALPGPTAADNVHRGKDVRRDPDFFPTTGFCRAPSYSGTC